MLKLKVQFKINFKPKMINLKLRLKKKMTLNVTQYRKIKSKETIYWKFTAVKQ